MRKYRDRQFVVQAPLVAYFVGDKETWRRHSKNWAIFVAAVMACFVAFCAALFSGFLT